MNENSFIEVFGRKLIEVKSVTLNWWPASAAEHVISHMQKILPDTEQSYVDEKKETVKIIPKEGKKLFLKTEGEFIGPMAYSVPIIATDINHVMVIRGFNPGIGLFNPKIIEIEDVNVYPYQKLLEEIISGVIKKGVTYEIEGQEKDEGETELWIKRKEGMVHRLIFPSCKEAMEFSDRLAGKTKKILRVMIAQKDGSILTLDFSLHFV